MENYPVRCEIHFTSYCETHKEEAACEILAKGETDKLKFDRTKDNNLRYVGSDPNNYVSFNNELWRIIGVMNNMEVADGTKDVSLLKLIRDESIGLYSWDYNEDGTYDNDWSTSTLMNLLNNGAYYNRTTGSYYNNSTTPITVDFSSTGLTSESRGMIASVVWKTGGISRFDNTASCFYNLERNTEVYENRPIEWTGNIGLMYVSDYIYATSGGSATYRETCLTLIAEYGGWGNFSDCYENDWLEQNYSRWTLSHRSTSENATVLLVWTDGISTYGNVSDYLSSGLRTVYPTLYLKNNVQIVSGSGSSTDPYQLSL